MSRVEHLTVILTPDPPPMGPDLGCRRTAYMPLIDQVKKITISKRLTPLIEGTDVPPEIQDLTAAPQQEGKSRSCLDA